MQHFDGRHGHRHMRHHAEGGGQVPADQKFQLRNLLGLLSLTRDSKRDYFVFVGFLILQLVSYQILTFSLQFLINTLFPMKKVSVLLLYLGAWILLFAAHAAVTMISNRSRVIIIRNLVANVRSEIIRKMQVLSIKYFDSKGTGATSAKVLMDVDRLQGFFDWLLSGFVSSVIGVIAVIPFLATIDPLLTLVTCLYIPTIPLLQKLFWKKVMERSYMLRNTSARLSEKLVDYISGIKLIRTFANEDEQSARMLKEVNGVRDIDIQYSLVMRGFQMGIQFFGDLMPVLLWVVVGIVMIYNGRLTMGAAVAYIGLVRGFLGGVQTLFSSFDQIVSASPSVTAIMEIIENKEIENPSPSVREFAIDGSIELRDVDFSYETRSGQKQLIGINMTIRAGDTVAFVGESGSGKSTLVSALLGLYPIKNGVIKYGQYDLSTVYLRRLRSQIAVMSQDTFLFNTSIYENIRFARMDATKDEIVDACRRAQIYDFIESLPGKFEENVGERGVQLSGGQRQRIGLARVFLRKPRIVFLDEPSSSLDIFTEQRLFDTFYEHAKDVTLVIVTHRLSIIKNVDRVFVFHEGRVIEQGGFAELARGTGMFARIVKANEVPAY